MSSKYFIGQLGEDVEKNVASKILPVVGAKGVSTVHDVGTYSIESISSSLLSTRSSLTSHSSDDKLSVESGSLVSPTDSEKIELFPFSIQ